jgi:RNA polymerase sigma factor (sigma-70 family)
MLAERFEAQRSHLRAVAYRMLGSLGDAEDAVQEAWLRLSRADPGDIANLPGWLTTVVGRVCLDMLRARRARREAPSDLHLQEITEQAHGGNGPEQEAVLADSVGRALLVVLDTLRPAERVAFVLHDVFAVAFDEIAPILGRSPQAVKKLASRARRRVQVGADDAARDLSGHHRLVEAFLAAVRAGDMDALLAVLAPDLVRHVDPVLLPAGVPARLRGARTVVEEARTLSEPARDAEPALVNGVLGAVVFRSGQLRLALTFRIEAEKITEFEVIADPERLAQLAVTVLDTRR